MLERKCEEREGRGIEYKEQNTGDRISEIVRQLHTHCSSHFKRNGESEKSDSYRSHWWPFLFPVICHTPCSNHCFLDPTVRQLAQNAIRHTPHCWHLIPPMQRRCGLCMSRGVRACISTHCRPLLHQSTHRSAALGMHPCPNDGTEMGQGGWCG